MKKVLLSLALTLAATGVQAQIYLAEFDGIWYQFNSEKMICGVSQHYHRGYDDELIGDGGKGYSGNINIPSTVDGYTVVAILANAFNGAEGITSVSIPSTVKYFGEYAFAKCDMPQFTVPASVDSLANYAFWLNNIPKITFEDSDHDLFIGCGTGGGTSNMFHDLNVEEIYLGRDVKGPAYSPFSSCQTLKRVTMGDKVTVLPLFNGCALLQKVSLGNGITLISASAFSGCSVLTSINLPEGITEIGNQAFGDCKSLTSLYLPSTLTTIRGYAFQSCVFTEITIPANVETIEEYGFWTDNLKKISFEDGDKLISVGKKNFEQLEEAYIGRTFANNYCPVRGYKTLTKATFGDKAQPVEYMFDGCSNLVEARLGKVDIIPKQCFSGCTSLVNFSCKNVPKTICESAFNNCKGFFYFTIGEGLETIEDNAFYSCSNMQTLTLPSTLKEVGKDAFYGDKSLKSITCRATIPPTCLNNNVFNYLDTKNCNLFVPASSVDAYQQANVWKNFFVQPISEATGIDGMTANNKETETWYSIDGKLLPASPTVPGLYIRNGKKVVNNKH